MKDDEYKDIHHLQFFFSLHKRRYIYKKKRCVIRRLISAAGILMKINDITIENGNRRKRN